MSKKNDKDIVTYDEPVNTVEEEEFMPEVQTTSEVENTDKSGFNTTGTKLTIVSGGTISVPKVIGNLTNIGEIGIESEEIDATTHDSEGGFGEFVMGQKDAGEVEIEGKLYNPEDFLVLLDLSTKQTLCTWEVQYPNNGPKWTFKAYVKSIKDGGKGLNEIASFTSTLRISGKPTFSSGGDA